jgi:hypothetical protein
MVHFQRISLANTFAGKQLRITFLGFALMTIALSGLAQYPSWLCQDSVQINYAWVGMEIVGRASLGNWVADGGKYVAAIQLRDDQKQYLLNCSPQTWLRNLKRKRTGFVTCRLLYAISGKSISVEKEQKIETWVRLHRHDEIQYWTTFLKSNSIASLMAP